EWLAAEPWPGNVRELSHLMERVTLLCADDEIDDATLEHLRVPLHAPAPTAPTAAPVAIDDADEPARRREGLPRSGGNVGRAAPLPGLGRNALRHRMRRHGIERPTLDELAGTAPRASTLPAAGAATTAAPVAPTPPAARAGDEPSWERKPVAVLAID